MRKLLLAFLFICASAYGQANPLLFQSSFNTATALAPTFSPVAGTYTGTQSVTISTATSGCGSYIYWSTVHNPPTIADTNGTAVSVAMSETVYAKVIGCPGYNDSPVGSAAYTINVPPSIPNPACFVVGAVSSFTSPSVNLAGAKAVEVEVGSVYGITSIVDNLNSTTLTCGTCGTGDAISTAYELVPSNTGAATFTVNGYGTMYGQMCVLPIVGVVGTYDGNMTHNLSGTSSCQAGSITPGDGTHISIAAYESGNSATGSTINGSYTIAGQNNQVPGTNVGGGAAYLVTGAATNPTWSTSGTGSACVLESFQ